MRKIFILISLITFLLGSTVSYALPPTPSGWGLDGRKEFTTDGTITAIDALVNKYITNQGASGEADIMLPAISWPVTLYFVVEETQVIEVNPPSGEIFILNTTTLDADDCIDSDNVVGSMLMVTRIKNASGTWQWLAKAIIGTWTDTGASD